MPTGMIISTFSLGLKRTRITSKLLKNVVIGIQYFSKMFFLDRLIFGMKTLMQAKNMPLHPGGNF